MKLIKPEYTSDTSLISTNVSEDDFDLYDNTISYSLNDTVIYIADNIHWVVRSLVADNLGNIPTGLNTDTKWVKVSETNRWKMFDQKTTSQTFNDNSIDVTLAGVNSADSVALLNLEGASVTVTVTNINDEVAYEATQSLVTTDNVFDAWSYNFAPIIRKTDVVFLDLPPYAQATYDISITFTGGVAKCGTCLIGKQIDLGDSIYGSKISSLDYSVKQADEFGDFVLTERSFSKTLDITAMVEARFTDYTINILNQFRATPVVWVGTEVYSSTFIYGFHKGYDGLLTFPTHNQINFEIEGLS